MSSTLRVASLCAVAWLSWSQPAALDARFIGNMALAISDGRVTVMTDFPYQSGYSGYMTYAPAEIRSSTASTLALITHRHADHWERDLFVKTGWMVAGPPDVVKGLPADRVLPLAQRSTFGPLQIERLVTPHARVDHYSYILTWHGKRLYFSGDTDSVEALLAARDLDVAFVSPWLYRAVIRSSGQFVSPWVYRSLVRPVQLIDAKRIVIYHHDANETMPECRDGCVMPRQGEIISIQ